MRAKLVIAGFIVGWLLLPVAAWAQDSEGVDEDTVVLAVRAEYQREIIALAAELPQPSEDVEWWIVISRFTIEPSQDEAFICGDIDFITVGQFEDYYVRHMELEDQVQFFFSPDDSAVLLYRGQRDAGCERHWPSSLEPEALVRSGEFSARFEEHFARAVARADELRTPIAVGELSMALSAASLIFGQHVDRIEDDSDLVQFIQCAARIGSPDRAAELGVDLEAAVALYLDDATARQQDVRERLERHISRHIEQTAYARRGDAEANPLLPDIAQQHFEALFAAYVRGIHAPLPEPVAAEHERYCVAWLNDVVD